MMITGKCVNDLYNETICWARVSPKDRIDGRTGRVYSLQEPLIICNESPNYRVLFDDERNCNPFFHLMEAIWMFSGRDDLWITKFNKNMAQFAEKGGRFHGAYGARWIYEVPKIVNLLKEPTTRRAYMTLWDNDRDLGAKVLDVPCNVGVSFQARHGFLDAYVFNRSNDLIWGMLGSNIVHFSMLLELVADLAGFHLGRLYQISVNPHYYQRHQRLVEDFVPADIGDSYPTPQRMNVESYRAWVDDCNRLIEGVTRDSQYHHSFFPDVALPMQAVYLDNASPGHIKANDWRQAAEEWIGRNRGK